MDGMLTGSYRVVGIDDDDDGVIACLLLIKNAGHVWECEDFSDMIPDLSDAATLGCLLHLVRLAHGNMQICTANENHVNWSVGVETGLVFIILAEDCESEAEALVAALEVAA
jgi:hypothetical protein